MANSSCWGDAFIHCKVHQKMTYPPKPSGSNLNTSVWLYQQFTMYIFLNIRLSFFAVCINYNKQSLWIGIENVFSKLWKKKTMSWVTKQFKATGSLRNSKIMLVGHGWWSSLVAVLTANDEWVNKYNCHWFGNRKNNPNLPQGPMQLSPWVSVSKLSCPPV